MYNSNRNLEDGSATVVRTVCAIVFLLFVAIYVFFYQEDTLALTQHILSGGATIYSRVIGGIIITIVLALLHFTTAKVMRTKPLCIYALSCFPSLYILAMLTDFDTSQPLSPWRWWAILMPLAAAVWWGVVYFLGELLRYRCSDIRHEEGYLARTLGCNIFILAAMMIGVGLLSNSNDITHYRLRMERLLMHGEYAKALEVGKQSQVGCQSHHVACFCPCPRGKAWRRTLQISRARNISLDSARTVRRQDAHAFSRLSLSHARSHPSPWAIHKALFQCHRQERTGYKGSHRISALWNVDRQGPRWLCQSSDEDPQDRRLPSVALSRGSHPLHPSSLIPQGGISQHSDGHRLRRHAAP